ncbi:hypothetical protein [Glutamicibacter halophytocola]|uniref:hypothetical protein n=1 Tax=Glutamicibacter halophytocola TaxID=1933880 RepID=UPI0015C52E9E|nr:hypothetical protein [Glutamicibacter halophytocola]NQD42436.1 hypothetical protein [Glutamicibacter halophytocola]
MTDQNKNTEANNTEAQDGQQGDANPANVSESTDTETNPATGQQGTQDGEGEDADEDKDKPKRPNEAAKYRTRLREAEAERDQLKADFETERAQLTDRVTLLEEATVKAWNPNGGLSIAALKAAGVKLSSLLNEDGTINAKAANEANKQAAQTLGVTYTDPSVVKRNHIEEQAWQDEMRQGNGETSWAEILNG